jgi:hypothetical protein
MTLLAGGLYYQDTGFMVYRSKWYTDPGEVRERKENKIHKSESNLTIAVSHVALCQNKRLIWLEGRVYPA